MRSLTSARARAASAQAEERELRINVARGRYVSIIAVRRAWAAIGAVFREMALSIPGKIASACEMRPKEEIEPVIRDEIFEMLDTMAGGADDVGADDGRAGRSRAHDADEGFAHDAGMRAGRSVDRSMPGRSGPGASRIAGPHRSHQERGGAICRRIETSAPFRCADEAEEAIRHELVPLKDALQAALDLLNERIASRKARRQLQ